MQILQITLQDKIFDIPPLAYAYSPNDTFCQVAVTSHDEDMNYIVLGNPFIIAFSSTLDYGRN